jgi:hypothetical protein
MQDPNTSPKVSIAAPCPKTWSELAGDDKKRFCSKCEKHVHNGEAMTHSEVVRIVHEGQGKVCMRLVTDESGTILYKNSEKRTKAASLAKRAGLAIAAGGLVAACAAQPKPPTQPEPKPVNDAELSGNLDPSASQDERLHITLGDVLTVEVPEGEEQVLLGEICVEEDVVNKEAPIDKLQAVKNPDQRQLLGRVKVDAMPDVPLKVNYGTENLESTSSPELPREILGTPGPLPPGPLPLPTPKE